MGITNFDEIRVLFQMEAMTLRHQATESMRLADSTLLITEATMEKKELYDLIEKLAQTCTVQSLMLEDLANLLEQL